MNLQKYKVVNILKTCFSKVTIGYYPTATAASSSFRGQQTKSRRWEGQPRGTTAPSVLSRAGILTARAGARD
jgi:hypothetical protein